MQHMHTELMRQLRLENAPHDFLVIALRTLMVS